MLVIKHLCIVMMLFLSSFAVSAVSDIDHFKYMNAVISLVESFTEGLQKEKTDTPLHLLF